MEEKSIKKLNRGIDIAVSILKHEFPFITGWDYKDKPETYRSSIYLVLKADMNLASEFYNSPIRKVYKHAEANVAYPFSPLEISLELNEDEKYELFKVIQKSLVEIYDEIPSELRHEFESYASEIKIPKELYIDGFILEKPKENINESESSNDKVSLAKSLIQQLFDEVSFIEQSTYNDRPLLTVYFDSDDTAANIESVFTHEICDTVKDYTSGEILCNPSWGPEWKTNRNNPDILIDAILLKYDDEGNVLNENKLDDLEEETNYIPIIEEIIEPFKNEDCVCEINVLYNEEDDMYSVYLVFSAEELNDKFYNFDGNVTYRNKLVRKIKAEINAYLPIDNLYVGSYGKPNCGWSPLNENWFKVPSSDYNSLEKIINLTMKEKYVWWKDIKINTLNYIELYGDAQIDAELTVDEEWGANQWAEFHYNTKFPGNKGWEDNDDHIRVSLGDIIDSTYAQEIRDDLREIFKYTLNIDVFGISFKNVYLIFE
jgi:hypothetical protein